jgi:acetyl esterase/lipase
MLRILLFGFLLLLSLLILFRAPAKVLWYLSILVTEFSILFFILTGFLLLFWKPATTMYQGAATVLGILSLLLFLLPTVQAIYLAGRVQKEFRAAFPKAAESATISINPLKLFTGVTAKRARFESLEYDSHQKLKLDFYPGRGAGPHPCVVVIHGGSWAAGDSRQLPELNTELAKEGYCVASINYRLAPASTFPAPVEDVAAALRFLTAHATELAINADRFFLLGRSAGGQVALVAACMLNDSRIKGVINFYGPTDMVWGYQHPTNPLVLNSRKVMEDYLGGTLQQVPGQYDLSSPTQLVKPGCPPTLLIFAGHDPLVSHLHGHRLAPKLKAAQVPLFELYLPWATHGFDYTLNGPGGQLSTQVLTLFLKVLRS